VAEFFEISGRMGAMSQRQSFN